MERELPAHTFDAVFLNDVLEHMVDPWAALRKMRSLLKTDGRIYASIPNVLFAESLLAVLRSHDWRYTEAGILDVTHLRFFTRTSILRLFDDAEYRVERIVPLNSIDSWKWQPAELGQPRILHGLSPHAIRRDCMQQGMTPDVSILIVNFNSGAVLPACLRSLRQWTDAKRTEVLIIDNASTDGSVARISKEFPEVHWILSDSNLGFGRANNIGATHARGRYLFLLNPDTELRGPVTGLLMALLDRAENADVGCAGAAVVDECGREGVAAGNFPTPVRLLKELFPSRVFPHRLRAQARADGLLEVDYVSGADP